MEKLGSFLDTTIKKIGITKKIKEEMALYQWEGVVGPQIQKNTRAQRIKGGILFIHVENSHWSQHLSFYKQSLINKLNHKLGSAVVKDIHFKVGPLNLTESVQEKTGEKEDIPDITHTLLEAEEINKIEKTIKDIPAGFFKEKIKNIMMQETRHSISRKEKGWLECRGCGAQFLPRHQEVTCPICRLKK